MTARPAPAPITMPSLLLFFLAFGMAAAPAGAQTTITRSTFTITFPSPWDTLPLGGFPGSDSLVMMMNPENESVGILTANDNPGTMTAEEFQAALEAAWAGSEGFERLSNSTKVLNGKTFRVSEWRDSSDADSSSRLRFYAYAQGGVFFVAWLGYDTAESPEAPASFEAALATLQVHAASIRPVARLLRRQDLVGARDVLGRNVTLSSPALARMPLYRLR